MEAGRGSSLGCRPWGALAAAACRTALTPDRLGCACAVSAKPTADAYMSVTNICMSQQRVAGFEGIFHSACDIFEALSYTQTGGRKGRRAHRLQSEEHAPQEILQGC